MSANYTDINISNKQATGIAFGLYGIHGSAVSLPGELDFNFRIESSSGTYLLKISRPDADTTYLEFHLSILQHVAQSDLEIISPVPHPDLTGKVDGFKFLCALYARY